MLTKPGMVRSLVFILLIVLWTSCDPTVQKKEPEKPAAAETSKTETALKGVLSDSLYTLVVDVATFSKFKNNIAFNLQVDTAGKLSLIGWNPPRPKPGSAAGTPVGVVMSTDSAVVKIGSAFTIGSFLLSDKKKIDDVIAQKNGKYVVFVPNINAGSLGYEVFVSGGIPGTPSGTTVNFLMAPTGTSLNPSPPYSDQ